MGKRKSKRKPQVARAKPKPLDRSFKCLFCSHAGTVAVMMSSKDRVGRLDCSNCGQHFETRISHLSREVDVYTDWLDAAEEADKGKPTAATRKRGRENDEDEDDDGLFEERGTQRRRREEPADGGDSEEDLPDVVGAY